MRDDAAPTAAPETPDQAASAAPEPEQALAGAHVLLLVGPPAVGKLSIARELARRTGALVVEIGRAHV